MCEGGVFTPTITMDAMIRFFRAYFAEDRHRSDVLGTVVEDVEAVGTGTWRNYLWPTRSTRGTVGIQA